MLSTLVCLAIIGLLWFMLAKDDSPPLEQPRAYLDQVLGRELDAAEFAARMPRWQQLLTLHQAPADGEIAEEALTTYREFQGDLAVLWDGELSLTVAVLLAELGRTNEALEELDGHLVGPEAVDWRGLVEEAYLGQTNIPPRRALPELTELSPPWVRDRLKLALAERRGLPSAANQIRQGLEQRGA